MNNWILIADAARASIFVPHSQGELACIREFAHPNSRAKNSDLLADRASQAQHAFSAKYAAAINPTTEPKVFEARQFAKTLAEELKRAADQHEFDQIILAAPPRFLGLLRQELDETVARKLVTDLAVDLTRIERHQLWPHLSAAIQLFARQPVA